MWSLGAFLDLLGLLGLLPKLVKQAASTIKEQGVLLMTGSLHGVHALPVLHLVLYVPTNKLGNLSYPIHVQFPENLKMTSYRNLLKSFLLLPR